jgi:hypothetical protein
MRRLVGSAAILLFAFGGGVAPQAASSVVSRSVVPISGSQSYGGARSFTFTGVAVVEVTTPQAGAPSTVQTTVVALAEGVLPLPLVILHGVLATTTVTLATLAALGIGS